MPANLLQFSQDKRPVVVWNVTRKCNLACVHCYSDSANMNYPGELDMDQARAFIQDLADFKAPVLLFSGGEPLIRKDVFELATMAAALGIRPVVSTNGTLINSRMAKQIKESGFGYVGVSLDGIGKNNDRFRGKEGAFDAALAGIRRLVDVGQRVGLRFTITRWNAVDVPAIFDLVEEENIDRVCFYHLVYSGRGSELHKDDLSHQETRELVDFIMARTLDWHNRGLTKDVLTVDNHTDGVYLYLRLREKDPKRAEEVLQLLRFNGGNSSGVGIACVDNLGQVHPDQFWSHYSFGNIKDRKFSQIWTDTADPLMAGLKNRHGLLKGRCGLCQYLDLCNGNFRVRAEAVSADVWAPDPACYLTDEEIGIA
jgi:radical SAM protein with 4Fe4S-binding SPASM domain